MAHEETLIKFKTDAWKSHAMVASYATRMHENRGTNRLKNLVEVDLCREFIVGKRIVDVGVGTGRASLPLARDGYDVTGIDVSQAMLEQCKHEAGETKIELLQGDLTALPVADETFDSLVSLNVAVHFPNWRGALREWARTVKPGGRLVFDVHSMDHLNAVAAQRGCNALDLLTLQQREDPSSFMLRVRAEEVSEAAEELGLSVVAFVPYGAVLGGGNINYFLLDSHLWGPMGDRALSWVAVDDRLFAFCSFLEKRVVARLSTHSTGRFMVVLEKGADDLRTREVLAYQRAIGAAFAGEPRLAGLREVIGSDVDAWGAELRAHLQHPANHTLFAMMLTSRAALRLRALLEELAGPEITADLFDANVRARIDERIYDFVKTWHTRLADPECLVYRGVDLGPSLEYELMRNVLDVEYFGKQQ
jgi:SAM-dependent methyltransferase